MKQNKVIISESENQASFKWSSSSWKFSAKSEDIVSVRKSAKFVYWWWTRLVLNGLASLEFSNCKFRILLTQKL